MGKIPVRSYPSAEIIRIIKADGWEHVRTKGDHYQFKHPSKKGTVTVQHPVKNLPVRNVVSILKQAGLR